MRSLDHSKLCSNLELEGTEKIRAIQQDEVQWDIYCPLTGHTHTCVESDL
jgi:hypothetical protein